jgi:hypothetical protein
MLEAQTLRELKHWSQQISVDAILREQELRPNASRGQQVKVYGYCWREKKKKIRSLPVKVEKAIDEFGRFARFAGTWGGVTW